MVTWTRADVVILTAIELEYAAVKRVDAGAVRGSRWVKEEHNELPVALREFVGRGDSRLRVAVARAPDTGKGSALTTLQPLVDALRPACIAMCGVCAGRPGKTALGDVVVAERLHDYDAGKWTETAFQADVRTYSLPAPWKIAAEQFDPKERFGGEDWWQQRPVPYHWQEAWVLDRLHAGVDDPAALPESKERCPQWPAVIKRLRAEGYLRGNKLTAKGKKRAADAAFEHPEFPDLSPGGEFMPFQLHVKPIGSGSAVREDVDVWGFITPHMRTTLALEMEASALADIVRAVSHRDPINAVVMKGVMDFANHGRDDHFKHYAARASAECLIAFLRDQLRGGAAVGDNDAADGHHAPVVDPQSRSRAPDLANTIARYRTRKTGSFASWDLRTAGPHPTMGHRPLEITLDDMYISLRFDTEPGSAALDRGAPITADDLVRPRRPQVVIGAAGSGKTTWMRWTFRRLIEDARAVPFFLELRAIAAAWKTPQDAGRAVDSYLADELTACSIADAPAVVAALLAEPSGLQPVILIDGWDELGAQGERVRERLVEFCSAFPQVVVVVSSRHYADTRPATAHAFETLYIQLLSDDDVWLLATRFHRRAHGLDESAGTRATNEFIAALAASPDARSLAGTALLLTMMLLLSREEPLPDRRHKLYIACLRKLLRRVDQRERDGAVVDVDQWRPDDSEERLRVVAELAFRMQSQGYRMQSQGYRNSGRAPIVRAWDAAVEMLNAEWTRDQRDRFLRWLVASAGVLVDRADGSVHFAHLGFQECLTAHYLFITRECNERVSVVTDYMYTRDWWETLRLWAGLIGDRWPEQLTPVFDQLRADADSYWLAGQIFADGTGRPSDFYVWVDELPAHLSDLFTSGDDCASAWGACNQSDRRRSVAGRLASARTSLHWLEGTWHARWVELAHLEVDPAPALLALEAPIDSAGAAARSRVLLGAAAGWPDGGELAVLRLWPSIRAAVSVRLQTAISLGAQPLQVVAMVRPFVARTARPWTGEDHAMARDLVGECGPDFVRSFVQDFRQDFAEYVGGNFVRSFTRSSALGFGRDFGQDFVRNFGRNMGRYLGRKWDRDWVHYLGQNWGRDLVRYFLREFGWSELTLSAPWLPAFSFLEAYSGFGRAAPRAQLAHGDVHDGVALLALFRAACRASFAPDDASLRIAVARACDAFDGDPLWPALARHVARISTSEDRALLENLARHPEQRTAPLSWGLQHYVRGDLVFDDDSVVTLDELCSQAALAPLPLLESMPDELDVLLDKVSP